MFAVDTMFSLETEVDSLESALRLARTIEHFDTYANAPVGPALDRVTLYLHRHPEPFLHRHASEILGVLRALGPDRAVRTADWLTHHATEMMAGRHWVTVTERLRRERDAIYDDPNYVS